MKFKNFKIRTKLLIGYLIVIVIAFIVGYVGFSKIQLLQKADTRMYERTNLPLGDVVRIGTSFQRMRSKLSDMVLSAKHDEKMDNSNDIDRLQKNFTDAMQSYSGTFIDDTDQNNFNKLQALYKDYSVSLDDVRTLALANNTKACVKIMNGKMLPISNDMNAAVDKMAAYNLLAASKISEDNTATAKSSTLFLVEILALGILLALVIAFAISAVISRPVKKMNIIAQRIAEGDLNVEININRKDEIGQLAQSLKGILSATNMVVEKAKLVAQGDLTVTLDKRSDNDELMIALSQMVARLNEIVAQIVESAANVASASSQFSSTTIEIAQGANEQAASAEEVSSSVEEMTSTIQQNTDNAKQTEKIASNSANSILAVSTSAQKSFEAIRQISDKIKVINAIAEKTDILAINAAIEAARAGEHGKGFAVVASEVRKLAETSQKAAIEINTLAATSLKVTEESVNSMMTIIPDIQKTANLVQEISAASAEQSTGAVQIASAIDQLSKVTQQNSASAEEMSSTAEELASQAEALQEIISFFNTGHKAADITSTRKSNTKNGSILHEKQLSTSKEIKLDDGDKDKEFVMY